MYRTVEFCSTFPNEWRSDEEGTPIGPGARELADAIVSVLVDPVRVTSAVEQHKDYGWGWTTEFEGVRFDNVLNPVAEDCYLTVHPHGYLLRWVTGRGPRANLDRYSSRLTEALAKVPQVSRVKWHPPRS